MKYLRKGGPVTDEGPGGRKTTKPQVGRTDGRNKPRRLVEKEDLGRKEPRETIIVLRVIGTFGKMERSIRRWGGVEFIKFL